MSDKEKVSLTGIATDGFGTCIPKYAKQSDVDSLRQLVEYMDKRLIECERELMAMQGILP